MNPELERNKGGRHFDERPCGRSVYGPAAARKSASPESAFADFETILDSAAPRRTNSTRRHPAATVCRREERHAAGFAGHVLVEAVLPLRRAAMARRRSGDPPPPPERLQGRNHEWAHLYNADVLSMPDKWEYPWYAAWDLAFHCIPIALVDSDFAKEQLILLLREWYMHPNGQMPAYEWAFGDVNPPVHAWAAWRVYKIEQEALRAKATASF